MAWAQDAPRETADEAYRLAVGLHNMPLYKEAAEKLKAFLTAYPQDPRLDLVQYRLGDSLVHLERHADALVAYQAVVDRYPASGIHAESLFRVGELNQWLGRDDQAAAAYALFQKTYKDHTLAPAVREKERAVALARLYRDAETDPVKALEVAKGLVDRLDPVGEEALFLRGALLFNAGQAAEAAQTYERLLARFPESARVEQVRLNAANARLKMDDLDGALAHLAGITKTQMDEVLYVRGTIRGRQKAVDAAAAAYREVVAQHPGSRFRPYCLFELGVLGQHEAWQQLLREYPKGEFADEVRYRMAVARIATGQDAEALVHLDAISAESPRRVDADLLRADLQSGRDLAGALATLDSLERNKVEPARLARARYAVALAALDQQKHAEAVRQLALILNDPASQDLHPDCLYRTGLAQEQGKQPVQAAATYRLLIQTAPASELIPYARMRLAVLDLEARPDAALAELQKIAADFPTFPHAAQVSEMTAEIRYRLAWTAYKKNDHPQAAAAFSLLMDHPVYGPEAAYLAGVSFRNANRPDEAEQRFARVLQQHPDYEFAAEARELLGDLLIARNKWQDAAQLYGSYAGTIREPAVRAEVELKKGMALYQINQATRAREALLYAADHGDAAVKAKALFFLGELLLMQKKHAEAKDYFLKVAVLYRHDDLTPAALLEAARCMVATGETEPSRAVLQRLVREFPKSIHVKDAENLLKTLK